MPVTEIPDTVTVLPPPTSLVAKVDELYEIVRELPEMRSSEMATVAEVVRSYVLSDALAVNTRVRSVMFAVLVVVALGE